jgi:hypothetical protein
MLQSESAMSSVFFLQWLILAEQALLMKCTQSEDRVPDCGVMMTELEEEMVPKVCIEVTR